jgi:hypothetical protein
LVFVLLAGAASFASSQPSSSGLPAKTLATIREPLSGFAQNRRYLAWVVMSEPLGPGHCTALVMQDSRTGRRSTRKGCVDVAPDLGELVLAGERGYWDVRGSSLSTEFSQLVTASVRDRTVEAVDFQSIYNEGSDHLVPPASDGRSSYFWTSPEDVTPGPLVRFDRRRARRLTPRISSLSALGAGEGRYAFARAIRTYDCAREPAWSPDGRLIAFARRGGRRCRGGLWVMNADGTGARRVAVNGRNPDWSPDGSKLAYDNGNGAVVVSDATSGNAQTVLKGADPAWSPDGSRLALARQQAILVAAPDGSGERIVTTGAVEPDWSPDGTKLVFTRTDKDNPGLAIIGVDGSGARSLTSTEDRQPAWSPDGRTIAYAHCSPASGLRTPILVRSHSGRPLATINPGGEAVSLAVTRTLTAALVRRNTWRLEIYSPKRRIVNLGKRRVASTLAASGRRVAFQAGRSIFVIDARSGRLRLVARAAGTPIGLSIVGRRIAWAENLRGGARVRAITLR